MILPTPTVSYSVLQCPTVSYSVLQHYAALLQGQLARAVIVQVSEDLHWICWEASAKWPKNDLKPLYEAASIAASILLVIVIGCYRKLYDMCIFLCKLGRRLSFSVPRSLWIFKLE